jgi:hypothetical protein
MNGGSLLLAELFRLPVPGSKTEGAAALAPVDQARIHMAWSRSFVELTLQPLILFLEA